MLGTPQALTMVIPQTAHVQRLDGPASDALEGDLTADEASSEECWVGPESFKGLDAIA